jgi:hypothetical protein
MKKSIRSSPWLRLIPVLFLVLIPIAFYIIEFKISPPHGGDEWAWLLFFLIILSLPVIVLSIIIFVSPSTGGIVSLVLIPLIIALRDKLSSEHIQFAWVICAGLLLSGTSGIFVGIWNSRGKQMQDNKSQNNLIR